MDSACRWLFGVRWMCVRGHDNQKLRNHNGKFGARNSCKRKFETAAPISRRNVFFFYFSVRVSPSVSVCFPFCFYVSYSLFLPPFQPPTLFLLMFICSLVKCVSSNSISENIRYSTHIYFLNWNEHTSEYCMPSTFPYSFSHAQPFKCNEARNKC